MAIELELYRNIRRLYNEGRSQRQIARILGCSRKTVKKYCRGEVLHDTRGIVAREEPPLYVAMEKEILAMLQENKTLPKKQRRTAKDIWLGLKQQGFQVGESTVRRYVRNLDKRHPEAFVPLDFEPGEAMQVDWGDMKAWIGGVSTSVSVFVTILPYSYALYASVFPDKTNACFWDGHVRAFEFYGGVAKRCIYDNLRNAVASGWGTTAVKQEEFGKLEAHYGFASDFCNPASGWEKGGVENAVAIIRRIAFTPMPKVADFIELQQHVDACCLNYIETHKIRYRSASIKELWTIERKTLNPLPLMPLETAKTVTALVNSNLTVLLEGTRYSVPLDFVGKEVTLKVSPFKVAVWHRGQEIYVHNKALHKGEHQYIPDHYLDLLTRKPRAVKNALPLKKGVMPPELKEFLSRCKAKDKEEQLLQVLLLARSVDPDRLLWALHQANQTSPTYQLVCFYLKITTPADEDAIAAQPSITVKQSDLAEYDSLMGGEAKRD